MMDWVVRNGLLLQRSTWKRSECSIVNLLHLERIKDVSRFNFITLCGVDIVAIASYFLVLQCLVSLIARSVFGNRYHRDCKTIAGGVYILCNAVDSRTVPEIILIGAWVPFFLPGTSPMYSFHPQDIVIPLNVS